MASDCLLGMVCGYLQALDGTLQIIAERNRLLGYRYLSPEQRFTFGLFTFEL